MSDTQNLHVPQTSVRKSMSSIMDAYNSQSKVALYDENSAMNCDEISGVKAKDIPLSALRPREPIGEDENGKPIYSKNQVAKDISARGDIRKAYQKMQGYSDEELEAMGESDEGNNRLSNVQEAEIEYIEDVPDDNEGLLHYLETCINNARANLEMLESLYAALNG